MAKIIRPDSPSSLSQAGISEGVAAQTGSGLEAIGAQQIQAGHQLEQNRTGELARQMAAQIDAMGRDYWEQSKRAHQTAVLTNAITDATIEYEKAIGQRSGQIIDENGNPTFQSLAPDVKSIGESIKEKIAGKIIDPEVASRFRNDFTQFIGSKQISAMKKARSQQIAFGKASLDNGLGTILKQGIEDEDLDNLPAYEAQGIKLIDDAYTSGLINAEQHAQMKEEFSISLREGAIGDKIQRNTPLAQSTLQSSPETLGISPESKAALDKELNAKVNSDALDTERAAEEAMRTELNQQANLEKEIEARIRADAIREDELLRQEKKLLPDSFKKLKTIFIKQAKARRERDKILNSISKKIALGENLLDEEVKLIDEHFKREVERQSQLQGKPATMAQKAQIASVYNRGVKTFSKELEQKLLHGKPEDIQDSLEAWAYINNNEEDVLDNTGFDPKAEAIAMNTELLIEHGGLNPQEALDISRNRITNIDQKVRDERLNRYNEEFISGGGDLSSSEIKNFMADRFDIENFLGFNQTEKIGDDVASVYRDLVRQAYIQTGDADTALNLADKRFQRVYGQTEFNKDNDFMYLPPEKLYKNIMKAYGLTIEDLKKDLEEDVKSFVPEDFNLKDDIAIFPNAGTFDNGTYYAAKRIKTEDGDFFVPITNPETGKKFLWAPSINKVINRKQVEQELKRERNVQKAQQREQQIKAVEGINPSEQRRNILAPGELD